MAITISGPQLVRINKKTDTDKYTLYHPQTGAGMVLMQINPNDPEKPKFGNFFDSKGNAVTAEYTGQDGLWVSLQEFLDLLNDEIHDLANVLEFVDAVANFPEFTDTPGQRDRDAHIGEVYIITNKSQSGRLDDHNQFVPENDYPENTLWVYVGYPDDIPDRHYARSGDGTNWEDPVYSWVPLGGDNSIYATKEEAIHTITVASDGNISFGYADEPSATHSAGYTVALASKAIGTISVSASGISGVHVDGSTFSPVGGSMAVTPVSTMGITQTISASSTINQIPSAKAVYDFAGAAGTLKIKQSNTGFLVGTSTPAPAASENPANLTAVGSGIQWSYVSDTTASYYTINAHVPYADTARSVSKNLGIGGYDTSATWRGFSYSGASSCGITFGGGLRADINGTDNFLNIWIKTGDGITVLGSEHDKYLGLTSSVAGTNLTYSNGVISHSNSGITSGVYSALAVDERGHATAGGQSVIFAAGPNDPDLGDLVVGGLAFIGTNSAAAGNYPTPGAASSSSVTNAAIDSSADPSASNS